jgi:hypothetical protein
MRVLRQRRTNFASNLRNGIFRHERKKTYQSQARVAPHLTTGPLVFRASNPSAHGGTYTARLGGSAAVFGSSIRPAVQQVPRRRPARTGERRSTRSDTRATLSSNGMKRTGSRSASSITTVGSKQPSTATSGIRSAWTAIRSTVVGERSPAIILLCRLKLLRLTQRFRVS